MKWTTGELFQGSIIMAVIVELAFYTNITNHYLSVMTAKIRNLASSTKVNLQIVIVLTYLRY